MILIRGRQNTKFCGCVRHNVIKGDGEKKHL
jgi:hypothetical protein